MAEIDEEDIILEEGDIDEDSISGESEGSGADCASRLRLLHPLKDIWSTDEIISGLQNLLGGNEAAIQALTGKVDSLTGFPGGILWACWLGRPALLQKILSLGVSPNFADNLGRTGMHLSALAGNAECLSTLLQSGANVNQWDRELRVTPLHCAASAKSLSCIQLLLKHGADINAGINNKSPLHYAVQSNALDCVSELLKNRACPDTPQVYTETPLHIAASHGLVECLKLLLEHGADARAKLGSARSTALHLAAEEGDTESVNVLIKAGALIDATNYKRQTPLHLACVAQASDTVEILTRAGANPRAADIDGRSPLHGALGRASRSADCVQLLLKAKANVNQPDYFGYTPMHLAALNEFPECVSLLLDNGGDVTLRTKGGHSVLSFIVRRTPEVIPKYIAKFDEAIKVTDHEIGDVDCELKLDFSPLVPTVGREEAALLLAFIDVGHRDVLKHPLCETFLYLKWRKIRKFFISSLIYHMIFVILYSIYIIGLYLRKCSDKTDVCLVPFYIKFVSYLLLCINLTLLAKELFQLGHDFMGYIKRWENWLQWMIIWSVFLCVMPGSGGDLHSGVVTWQHHIAAISIFLVWVELMMIVGRFPMFGLYVQMFKRVALNFSKFLMAYSCLLIAFALSFGVLFTNYPSYSNIMYSLLKTVIMMAGELEFEDIFFGEESKSSIMYPVTTHILFLAFVLLVTIILTNLLVGLAVSDIQALQESAGLDRLVRQAELVARLESMLFSPLLHRVPPRILGMLHKAALLLAARCRCALSLRPNDPRENRIPKDLITSIYKLVASRKELPKNTRNTKYTLVTQMNRNSMNNQQKYPIPHKKNSPMRPRTTSDTTNVTYRHVLQSQPESDMKIVITRINDLTVKLDKLQKIIEGKFILLTEEKITR